MTGYPAAIPLPRPLVLVQLGDIWVTQTEVGTPYGRYPLACTSWGVSNHVTVSESLPTSAVVLTIIFVWFCLLGLLFLLVKERRVTGFVVVTVSGPGRLNHSTTIPVQNEAAVAAIDAQVNYVRTLAALSSGRP